MNAKRSFDFTIISRRTLLFFGNLSQLKQKRYALCSLIFQKFLKRISHFTLNYTPVGGVRPSLGNTVLKNFTELHLFWIFDIELL